MDVAYRNLRPGEATSALFAGFDRFQQVTRCWRKENGRWIIRDIAFNENWDEKDIARVCAYINDTAQNGGQVCAAFDGDRLIGYAAVVNFAFGSRGQYVALRSLHVTRDRRGWGVGRVLFMRACAAAKQMGAEKMYISGQSSVETQAFYKAVGCVEAAEYYAPAVEDEPFDCQLERDLADL